MAALQDQYGNYSPNLVSLGVIVPAVGGGGDDAGNGAPGASTSGNLYVQWDSVPPGQVWWKDANGNWN